MATAGQAEVLPVVLQGRDDTGSAWASFKKGAQDGKAAVEQLRGAFDALSGGNAATGLRFLGNATRFLVTPYGALLATVLATAKAADWAHGNLMMIADAASEVGTGAANVAGLADRLKAAGAGADTAIAALKNLRTQLDLNQRDGGYLENLFKLNSSSLYDASGNLKSINQAYAELAEYIKNARNNTEALEIATNAFGSGAATSLKKAIDDGATSLEKLGNGRLLDPLIQQSREIDKIWAGIFDSKRSDSWAASLTDVFASLYNNVKLAAAAALGSSVALNLQHRINHPDQYSAVNEVYDNVDHSAIMAFGKSAVPTTKTPSNRKVDQFALNEFDRAINTITKHVAVMEADASAVGKTAGEHEQLRVRAQLLNAAERAGIEITGERAKRFELLGLRARVAADNLAYLKLKSDVLFERDQLGRSAMEQVVSSRLRSAGVDPTSDQGVFLAQQIRLNEVIKDTQDLSKDALKGLVSDLRNGVSEGQAFANMLGRISDKLMDKTLDAAINALTGRGGSAISSLLGFGSSAGALTGSDLALNQALFPGFGTGHAGAVIGQYSTGTKRASPTVFDGAPRFHGGGTLGADEIPFIGLRGEEVGFPGDLRRKYGGSAGASISIGDVNVILPEGTSPENAQAVAKALEAAIGPIFEEKLRQAMRIRGALNRGY